MTVQAPSRQQSLWGGVIHCVAYMYHPGLAAVRIARLALLCSKAVTFFAATCILTSQCTKSKRKVTYFSTPMDFIQVWASSSGAKPADLY